MGGLLKRKPQKKNLTDLGFQDGFEFQYTKANPDRGPWTREGSGEMHSSWLVCVSLRGGERDAAGHSEARAAS